jgi:transposase-like protein
LPGLSKSARIAFPKARLQRCVLHKVRNTVQLIKSTDEKEFLSDLKKIYKAPSKEEATRLLNEFKKKWSKYRAILEDWLYSMDEW